jgi:lactate permease
MVILRKPGPADRAMEFVTFGALLEPHAFLITPPRGGQPGLGSTGCGWLGNGESGMPDFFFACLPIAFLLIVMTKPRPWPSPVAFALGAMLAGLVAWGYFQIPVELLRAAVVSGILDALTPISIIFGALLFFAAMEKTGTTTVLQSWLRGISPHPVAQIMIAGFAFIFFIEAAAGFGTPAALAAPILVALGFPALPVAVVCLLFNTIPTAFGAVGTPVWFGFELLALSSAELREVAIRAAWLQTVVAFVVPVVALRFLVGWAVIWRSLPFIWLSIGSCVLPFLATAYFSYEFPAIAGGLVGLPCTILLARFRIGLPGAEGERGALWSRTVLVAALPLLATALILLVTRIPALGLRGWLTATAPAWRWEAGAWGEFVLSFSGVLQWRDILGQGLNWSHALFYVPSIVPFFLTAGLALWLGRADRVLVRQTVGETVKKIAWPVLALFGALVFVKLLMVGGDRAATMILGQSLAGATGDAWPYFAPFLGALGSFFSGSTTISNLTFGPIQQSIAESTGTSVPLLLALQLTGAAMGNAICIHNIVAVAAVLSLRNVEGEILRRAAGPVLLYGALLALLVAVFAR